MASDGGSPWFPRPLLVGLAFLLGVGLGLQLLAWERNEVQHVALVQVSVPLATGRQWDVDAVKASFQKAVEARIRASDRFIGLQIYPQAGGIGCIYSFQGGAHDLARLRYVVRDELAKVAQVKPDELKVEVLRDAHFSRPMFDFGRWFR